MSNITPTSKEFYNRIQDQFILQADEKTFQREVSFMVAEVSANKQLQQCDPISLLKAALNISQTGMTLNPVLKQAYLIPRWTPSGKIACLEPSYQGLCKMITDMGEVTRIQAQPVYEEDIFDVEYGSSTELIHKRKFKSKNIILFYAIAHLGRGGIMFEVMDLEDINEIRDMSEGWKAFESGKIKSTPWSTHYNEMAKKTVIKRLCKTLPKSDNPQWEHIQKAIDLDNSDHKIDLSNGRGQYLEQLIQTSTYSDEDKLGFEDEIYEGMTPNRYEQVLRNLKNNQIPPLDRGNMTQKEIAKEVQNKVENPKA